MSTQTPPLDPHLENVQPITDAIEMRAKSRMAKLTAAACNGSRFLWRIGLGTTVTVEEQAMEVSQGLAHKGEVFEKKASAELVERAQRARQSAVNMGKAKVQDFERLVGNGTHHSLHLLGAPSRRDMAHLQQMAEKMSVTLAELQLPPPAKVKKRGSTKVH